MDGDKGEEEGEMGVYFPSCTCCLNRVRALPNPPVNQPVSIILLLYQYSLYLLVSGRGSVFNFTQAGTFYFPPVETVTSCGLLQ
jgi:hypothetical protein